MYLPPHFEESSVPALHDLIGRNPFGTLITHTDAGLDANHIPFHLERGEAGLGVLTCHVARGNLVWQEVADGAEVLVVFREADAYVSPQWYPSKQEHHRQVPTWNYLVVHAHGRIRVHDDAAFVRRNVAVLTRRHEASQPIPWKMGDAPRDFTETLLTAIVGLRVEITRLVGKVKLSQNKEVRDIRSAGEALKARGDEIVGAAMCAAAEARQRSGD